MEDIENAAPAAAMPAPKRPNRKATPAAKVHKTVEDIPKHPGEKTYKVILHDSKEIPPNGQFIGVNGNQYFMKPGQVYNVPRSVLEVLNNAIMGVPDINEQMQVVGVRQAPRLPYTLQPD